MRTRIVYSNPKRYYVNDVEVTEEEYRAATPSKIAEVFEARHHIIQKGGKAGWPMEMDSLAVHPDQIPEMVEADRKAGVPTEYNPVDGRPIITDNAHRSRYLRHRGVFDRDACYNQPGPR